VEHEGQRRICLRDPLGYSDEVLVVGAPILYLVSLLDGTRSVLDIQAALARRYGDVVPREELQGILQRLDEAFFLDNARFRRRMRREKTRFRQAAVREAAHAGAAYPAEAKACERALAEWFGADGVAESGRGRRASRRREELVGILAPHIDPHRGAACYAKAYGTLAASAAHPELIVVFGTSHRPMEERFCVTRKAYRTPIGPMETDAEVIDRLEERFGEALYRDELNHKTEHSIEFQVLFLRHVFPEAPVPKIVPILCGSLHEDLEQGTSPREDAAHGEFHEALREAVAATGRRALYVAGVDLAHFGVRFGHSHAPGDDDLRRIEDADRASLRHLESLSGEGFFHFIADERDARNVCGVSAIVSMMDAIDASRGEVLGYAQSVEPDTGSVVTFASMAFYRRRVASTGKAR